MDENEIRKIMSSNPLLKSSFEDVLSIDEVRLPVKRPASFIFNLDPSHKPGSHWVAVYYTRRGQYWYFDSYANSPPYELMRTYDYLREWTLPVQSIFSNVCGQYCIFFIYLCSKGLSWHHVSNEMKYMNDIQVRNFVKNLNVHNK